MNKRGYDPPKCFQDRSVSLTPCGQAMHQWVIHHGSCPLCGQWDWYEPEYYAVPDPPWSMGGDISDRQVAALGKLLCPAGAAVHLRWRRESVRGLR